jgi:hypothetical protein
MACPHDVEHECAAQADRLLAATLYLMSAYARTRCVRLAGMIEHHLGLIACNGEVSPCVGAVARQLVTTWHALQPGAPELHRAPGPRSTH